MPDLTTALLALRPAVDAALSETATPTVGDFLHRTLRPVLKLQNELLLLVVADFVREHHIPFQAAGAAERERVVAELVARNVKLRYTIIGIISGMFTPAETAFYRQHRAELNRRLLELASQRVQSQVATVAEHVVSAGAAT
ncbi:hypothetical protein [Hymenobacter sp. GOD-10R]|uniref:hypothetical protein n=1 Tax=Hymenobacter sp. GOD-10R TaxID=3093922 RepID=UPI002D7841EA|nr:hypothetical protein [Hymenobacter sp. GOD-10R]WRQ29278.1 hypothetical protein SD425_03255 [Hymenobacter sp. GOD-10R]